MFLVCWSSLLVYKRRRHSEIRRKHSLQSTWRKTHQQTVASGGGRVTDSVQVPRGAREFRRAYVPCLSKKSYIRCWDSVRLGSTQLRDSTRTRCVRACVSVRQNSSHHVTTRVRREYSRTVGSPTRNSRYAAADLNIDGRPARGPIGRRVAVGGDVAWSSVTSRARRPCRSITRNSRALRSHEFHADARCTDAAIDGTYTRVCALAAIFFLFLFLRQSRTKSAESDCGSMQVIAKSMDEHFR